MPQGIEKAKCNKRQQATIGRAIIGKDEVPSSNLGSSSKIPENFGFWGFFVAKSYFVGWPKISDPHRDPHAEMRQRNQWT